MKNLTNKNVMAKDVETTAQVGDVQIWYRHNLDEDKIFFKKTESTEAAARQLAVIYNLMRFMKDTNLIADYNDNNSGGFDVLGADNKSIRTVIRDELAGKDTDGQGEEPKEGDLKLWYVQQLGIEDIFCSEVSCPNEALEQLSIIYDLMLFLYENNQIPDYCNTGGLEVYEDDGDGGFEWCEWCDEDGLDIDEVMAMHTDCDE